MHNCLVLLLVFALCVGHVTGLQPQSYISPGKSNLRVSAVVNDSEPPYHARIECWELASPFIRYPTVGEALQLGDVNNVTYVALPPKSQEGLHHPPYYMYFVLISGLAHVRLPADPTSDGLWIAEGVNPLIIATDTLGIGHYTDYPGDKETVALQIPFKDGIVPKHKIVDYNACPVLEENDTRTTKLLAQVKNV